MQLIFISYVLKVFAKIKVEIILQCQNPSLKLLIPVWFSKPKLLHASKSSLDQRWMDMDTSSDMSSCPSPCPKQTRTRTQDFREFGHGLGHGHWPSHDFGHGHGFGHAHVRISRTWVRTRTWLRTRLRTWDSELRRMNVDKMNFAFFKSSLIFDLEKWFRFKGIKVNSCAKVERH